MRGTTFLIKEANQILGVKIPVARKRKNMTREWPKADLQDPFLTLKTLKLNGQKVEQALDPSHPISSAFMWINGSHVNLFAPPKPRHLHRESKCHLGTIDAFLLNEIGMSGFFPENRESKCVGAGVGKDSLASASPPNLTTELRTNHRAYQRTRKTFGSPSLGSKDFIQRILNLQKDQQNLSSKQFASPQTLSS